MFRRRIVILLIVVGMMCGVVAAIHRHQFETRYRTVEIVFDGEDAEDLAGLYKISRESLYRELKRSGVHAISLAESTPTRNLEIRNVLSRERVGKGYDPGRISAIRKAGLAVVPRPLNHPAFTRDEIQNRLRELGRLFPNSLLLFGEEQVLGADAWIPQVGKIIRDQKLVYGFVEFAGQRGDLALKAHANPQVLRVHSIPYDELVEMPLAKAIRRYLRAVRERNVQILYVHAHPYPLPGKNLLETNISMLQKISNVLADEGYTLGRAMPMEHFQIPSGLKWGITLGILGGVALLPLALLPLVGVIAIFLIAAFLGVAQSNLPALKFLAFGGALLLPVAIHRLILKTEQDGDGSYSSGVVRAALVLSLALGSGLMVAGLLTETRFLSGEQQFLGVKFAFLLPLLVIAAQELGWGSLRKIPNSLRQPLTLGGFLGIIAIIVGLCVYVLRTGNFGLPMFPFEENVRVFLEETLGARPRFREILLGYPALFALGLGPKRLGSYFPWLLVASILVPISVINTFCHLHIPVIISVLRTLYGFIVGSLIGWIVMMFLRRMAKP